MLRALNLIYHLAVAFSAVALLICLMIGFGYLLLEGFLGYFFGVDLADWIFDMTGFDLDSWFGQEDLGSEAEPDSIEGSDSGESTDAGVPPGQ